MVEHIRITRVEKQNESLFCTFLPEDYDLWIPNRFCLGAAYDSYAVGVIVFSVDRVMSNIEWIYVDENYRRKGVAKRLIESTKKMMDGTEVMGLSAVFFQGNSTLEEFFIGAGFGVFEGDMGYTLSLNDVVSSPKVQKLISRKDSDGIKSVNSMVVKEKEQLKYFLKSEIVSDQIYYKCDDRYSFTARREGAMTGCLICSDSEGNDISIDLLYNKSETFFTAVSLLKSLFSAIENGEEKKQNLHFVAANSEMLDFVTYATGYKEEEMDSTPTLYAVVAL